MDRFVRCLNLFKLLLIHINKQSHNQHTGETRMPTEQFDPLQELNKVKEVRAILRRKQYRKSKLQRYRYELVAMRRTGASFQDLSTWLQTKHRMKIHRSSIARYLSGLPEMIDTPATSSLIQV